MEITESLGNKPDELSESIETNKNLMPVFALLGAVLLWGGSFSAMRVAVGALHPVSVMWLRMMMALVIFLPVTKKLIADDYIKGDWRYLIPMVLFQPCLYFLLESYALTLTTSTQAGVISASVPLMVSVGAWIYLSESMSVKTIFGMMISIAGVVCLTFLGKSDGSASNPVLGNFLETLAMASAAANMLAVKKLSERYNPWALTAIQIIAGSIFFSPGLYYLINTDLSVWNIRLIVSIIFLGGFVTLGAFGLYNWGMSKISASKASAFINLVPVAAVFFGWTLLGEGLNLYQSFAALFVICGVWLSQRGEKDK